MTDAEYTESAAHLVKMVESNQERLALSDQDAAPIAAQLLQVATLERYGDEITGRLECIEASLDAGVRALTSLEAAVRLVARAAAGPRE